MNTVATTDTEERELNELQHQAASALDCHVSVTAGPGAGKTTVLVERYLQILRIRGITVDQIVAITFTNRAANEMRERLRRELDRVIRTAPISERPAWIHHKRTLDGGVITTIHGFCARLLREFPLEAGVDPQFVLLDEHQSAILIESVIDETLTEFITHGRESVSRLAAEHGRARLVDALIDLYHQTRNQGLDPGAVKQSTIESHARPDEYPAIFAELDRAMLEYIAMRALNGDAEERRRLASRRWPVLAPILRELRESGSLAEYCHAIDELRECRPAKRGATSGIAENLDRLLFAYTRETGRPDPFGLIPQICFDQAARQNALDFLDALDQIDRRLDVEKRRLGALDFDDLQLRALKLLDGHPEVLMRAARRYRFYLIDEFQDTNALQRGLLQRLALATGRSSNLFIVGDRKQSIYGFRGADVDVFREMTAALETGGGRAIALDVNFRSRPELIRFFNHLFERIFFTAAGGDEPLAELGHVGHEPGESVREPASAGPLVELLIDVRGGDSADGDELDARERDAAQIARRISTLVGNRVQGQGIRIGDTTRDMPVVQYRDIAVLFRALTGIGVYESALRRAGIPYFTVQGKGFYEREEINDLIQLLRYLDNTTDEIALASVLRSPLAGLSDETILALRCAPAISGDAPWSLRLRRGVRDLRQALVQHRLIDLIDDGQREALDRIASLLNELVRLRNRVGLAELLRRAVAGSDYQTVIAANFDGGQRLANVEKLFVLAERFEDSGAHLIRDFVRFVHDFEAAGGREGEGQIDESANAVRLMTVHQSKGLEFPVVIVAELHRRRDVQRDWYLLDRHRGLTVKVPDGRGGDVAGRTMMRFRRRADLREDFEGARLLYVAATRAQERLILTGAARELEKAGRQTWLESILRALDSPTGRECRILEFANGAHAMLTINLMDEPVPVESYPPDPAAGLVSVELTQPGELMFPLLAPVRSDPGTAIQRFSVSQLVNYQRCARQYYFDRILHAPSSEQVDWWNGAEAPEPPANLTASLRGAVIHRFCEKYDEKLDADECLATSLDEVLRYRQAQLGESIAEINRERAIADLRPLVENYLSSSVRRRIESAAREAASGGCQSIAGSAEVEGQSTSAADTATAIPNRTPGVFSEQRFRLRRRTGILTGTIDKLLVFRDPPTQELSAEIIDFKTSRFRVPSGNGRGVEYGSGVSLETTGRRRSKNIHQLAFEFAGTVPADLFVRSEVEGAAADYRLQMQAYALAVRELVPEVRRIQVTLHFLDPNIEVTVGDDLLGAETCAQAIDQAAESMLFSKDPERFPVNPAEHCRTCSFLSLCPAGGKWLSHR